MCDLLSAGPGFVTVTGYDYNVWTNGRFLHFNTSPLPKAASMAFLVNFNNTVSCARLDLQWSTRWNSCSLPRIEYLCTEKRVQVVPKSVSIPSWCWRSKYFKYALYHNSASANPSHLYGNQFVSLPVVAGAFFSAEACWLQVQQWTVNE